MTLNIEDIKIKIWIVENPTGSERGIATIKMGDISITGFRILESNYKKDGGNSLWLAPPAYRGRKGKFHPVFWLEDKELWQKMQEKVIAEYHSFLEKRPDLKIQSDGIPIIEEDGKGTYSALNQ